MLTILLDGKGRFQPWRAVALVAGLAALLGVVHVGTTGTTDGLFSFLGAVAIGMTTTLVVVPLVIRGIRNKRHNSNN
jgi:hypothetical protein